MGSVNVTSLWTNLTHLRDMPMQVVAVCEAAIANDKLPQVKAMAAGMGMTLVLTGPDPEQTKLGGGVAILAKKPAVLRKLTLLTDEGRDGERLGRLVKGAVQDKSKQTYNIICIYGWTGGDHDSGKAHRTDALLQAGRVEVAAHPLTPTILTGDLNAHETTLPTLVDMQCDG